MDISEKIELIERPPTQEIVTRDELIELLKTNPRPKHYIGLEISGFLHLGSLISTGFKINDFIKAGVKCTVFLADWHTMINDKLGGDWEIISKVSKYYADAFKLVCRGVEIVLGSDLYESKKEYWAELIKFTKHISLARTMRTLTIMGRSEEEKVDLSKLFYPPMQAIDIHSLDVDIAHAGMDQRKIHMLVREIFPKMGWKVPVAVHHRLLPSLLKPIDSSEESRILGKMSKSDPKSSILIHDSDEEIQSKIKKAWCEEGNVQNNPLLEILKHVIFHEFNEVKVERPANFGGNVTYSSYSELESDFGQKKLHPTDLKKTVSDYLVKIVSPVRKKLELNEELAEAIRKGA